MSERLLSNLNTHTKKKNSRRRGEALDIQTLAAIPVQAIIQIVEGPHSVLRAQEDPLEDGVQKGWGIRPLLHVVQKITHLFAATASPPTVNEGRNPIRPALDHLAFGSWAGSGGLLYVVGLSKHACKGCDKTRCREGGREKGVPGTLSKVSVPGSSMPGTRDMTNPDRAPLSWDPSLSTTCSRSTHRTWGRICTEARAK